MLLKRSSHFRSLLLQQTTTATFNLYQLDLTRAHPPRPRSGDKRHLKISANNVLGYTPPSRSRSIHHPTTTTTTTMTNSQLQTLALLYKVSDETLELCKKAFKTVHYHPDGKIPKDKYAEVEVWASSFAGLPSDAKTLEDVKNTKLVQLASAGANNALTSEFMKNNKGWNEQFALTTASGIHSKMIPQYIIMSAITLHNSTYLQSYHTRSNQKWLSRTEAAVDNSMAVYGRTAGMLGYGSIAREAARLLKALHVNVIAANSNGERTKDEGFMWPGTGDAEGSIPEKFYSTKDKASFDEFLSKSDILICSLPSTPQTHYMLKKEDFAKMPARSFFINIGRGDLAPSDDIIAALDAPTGIIGAALDVTDPEPLTAGHPLYSDPRVFITPHVSGHYEKYMDSAAECTVENVKRYREKGTFFNVVDPKRGY